MKQFLVILILLSASFQIVAQDTTCVFINNSKASQAIYKEGQKTNTIVLKKSSLKNLNSLFIKIKGEHVNESGFDRELQVTSDSLLSISEAASEKGKFDINNTKIKQQLQRGKALKLYLILNPSNPNMMRPSKIIYLCNIKAK